jgi:hypothetical protein
MGKLGYGDEFLIYFGSESGRFIYGLSPPLIGSEDKVEPWVGPMQPQSFYQSVDLIPLWQAMINLGETLDSNGNPTHNMLIGYMLDSNGDDDFFYADEYDWSGAFVDDSTVTALVRGDIVWTDSMIIPGPCEPCETCTGQFVWEDVPYSCFEVVVETVCVGGVCQAVTNHELSSQFCVLEKLEAMFKCDEVDYTECTPEAWCISNVVGNDCGNDGQGDIYALATNCDTHQVPAGVNDWIALGTEECGIDISHLNLASSGGAGPILFEEHFDTFPNGWDTDDFTHDTFGECSFPPEAYLYFADVVGTYSYLESPIFDGTTADTLTFTDMKDTYSSGDNWFRVFIISDNTFFWEEITPWTNPVGGTDQPCTTWTVDISSYAGDNMQIAFEWSDDDWYLWSWTIDEVYVRGPGMVIPGDEVWVNFTYQVDLYPSYAKVILEYAEVDFGDPGLYTLVGVDDWGDGWDACLLDGILDAFMDVYVNGVQVVTDFTVAGYSNFVTFPAEPGDHIEVCYFGTDFIDTEGECIWEYEHAWWLLAPGGELLLSDGTIGFSTINDVNPATGEPFDGCFTIGACTDCPSEECLCPPGILGWIPAPGMPITGNDPGVCKTYSQKLPITPGTDMLCLRLRLDTTAAAGLSYAGPGIGFHVHEFCVSSIIFDPITGEVADFCDDFEDGEIPNPTCNPRACEDALNCDCSMGHDDLAWFLGCPTFGVNWEQISSHCWRYDFPAEPIDNALVWATEIEDAYYAELFGWYAYSLPAQCTLTIDLSADGGNNWFILEKVDGPAVDFGEYFHYDLTPWAGKSILIRVHLDNYGGVGSGWVEVCDFYIMGKQDIIPPTASISLSGNLVGPGQYAGPVTVTITATDNIAVKEIHYILDGVETIVAGDSTTFTVGDDGEHTIEFWAVDNFGNVGAHSSVTFNIDNTPPTIAITAPEPGLYLFGNKLLDMSKIFIIGAFTVEATADDAQGVIFVRFDLNGEPVGADVDAPYSAYIAVKNMGAATIEATAVDGVGNSASDSLDVTYYKFL